MYNEQKLCLYNMIVASAYRYLIVRFDESKYWCVNVMWKYCMLLVWQAFWNEMRGLRPRVGTFAGGTKGAGVCLSPYVFLVRSLLSTIGHRRWILSHGR